MTLFQFLKTIDNNGAPLYLEYFGFFLCIPEENEQECRKKIKAWARDHRASIEDNGYDMTIKKSGNVLARIDFVYCY